MDGSKVIEIMPLMSIREYARSRKSRGLPGGSPAAVVKALQAQRIKRCKDGRIDSDLADLDWHSNTLERGQSEIARATAMARRQSAGQAVAEAAAAQGARWFAGMLCTTARRQFPAYVSEHWPDMPASEKIILAWLFCGHLEVWSGPFLKSADLGPFDFRPAFGTAEEFAAALYRDTCAAHSIPVDPASVPIAADGEFIAGARAAAFAICSAARRLWPSQVLLVFGAGEAAEGDGGCETEAHVLALMLALLEGWAANYLTAPLPSIDWALFGTAAPSVAERYERYRKPWEA